MSKTPETDAVLRQTNGHVAIRDHARNLEVQRDQLAGDNKLLRECVQEAIFAYGMQAISDRADAELFKGWKAMETKAVAALSRAKGEA